MPEHLATLQETLRSIRTAQKSGAEQLEPFCAVPSITYRKTDAQATPPTRKSELAAGYDVEAIETTKIEPGETALVPIGLAFNIPAGYFGIT